MTRPSTATAALLLVLSCRSGEKPPERQASGSHAQVKVSMGDTVVVEYEVAQVTCIKDGDTVNLDLESPDGKHRVPMSFKVGEPGEYPISFDTDKARAHLTFMSEGALPAFSPGSPEGMLPMAEGTLAIEEISGPRCKGTFRASATHRANGAQYTVEGAFDAPLTEI
jgi:hypothetical protein